MQTENPVLAFTICEAIVRLSLLIHDHHNITPQDSTNDQQKKLIWPKFNNSFQVKIQNKIDTFISVYINSDIVESSEELNKKYKSSNKFCAILLLVYFVNRSVYIFSDGVKEFQKDIYEFLIPSRTLIELTLCFLRFLLDKEALVQDIATLGVCHCYRYAVKLSEIEEAFPDTINSQNENVRVTYKEATLAIANNVIACIMKEKRALQPTGFGVAGTTSNSAAPAAPVMPSLIGGDGMTAILNMAPNAIAQAARQINGTNQNAQGNNPNPNPGINENANTRRGDNINQGSSGNHVYGVHAEVCKIAKKTGDPAAIFAFLSMVRCDPSFGIGSTLPFYERYKVDGQ